MYICYQLNGNEINFIDKPLLIGGRNFKIIILQLGTYSIKYN